MSKEIYISSTPHETRLAIVEDDALTEMYYERENEYSLAGSIYNGKVTRVLPGMQSSFVDIGLERDAFLYITDFMEEAGDSADFEASAGGGDRAPRGDRGGDRGGDRNRGGQDRGDRDRGDRDRGDKGGSRSEQPRVPAEPTDADLFTEAVAGLDPSRPVVEGERSGGERSGGERSGGGGRRGGRNRRDRGGDRGGDRNGANQDGAPRQPRPETAVPVETFSAPLNTGMADPEASIEDLGEGAPGAEGSRRWRGRRGRRGNRGGGPRVEDSQAQAVDAVVTPSGFVEESDAELRDAAVGFDETPESTSVQRVHDEDPSNQDLNPREFAEAPVRREDRGGRRERGGREGGRAPREFAPASLYGVEAGATTGPISNAYGQDDDYAAAPAEPVILPGEVLRKYLPGGDVEEAKPAASAGQTSAPDFELKDAWDGGLVLPGETIRPRGPQAGAESREPRREDRGGRDGRSGDRGGDRSGDRGRGGRGERGGRSDDRGGRGERERSGGDRGPRPEQARSFAAPVDPPVTAPVSVTPQQSVSPVLGEADVREPIKPYAELSFATPLAHKAVSLVETASMPVSDEPVSDEPASDEPELIEEEVLSPIEAEEVSADHDYEPTEASASFRVDPVPPSEYRQPTPVLEEASFAESVEEAAPAGMDFAVESPAVEFASETDPADLHHVSPELRHAFEAQSPDTSGGPAGNELTSINAMGEMHSTSATEATPHVPALETAEPTSPIEHESAVVDPIFVTESAFSPAAPYFAPGEGVLEEEELVDDEDGEPVSTMRASAFDLQEALEDEDGEQETLENAADLGVMIREMSIDQITRTEPAVDEDEDDFEEDFFEEDQDFESGFGNDAIGDDEGSEEDEEGAEHPDRPALDEIEDSAYAGGFEGTHAAPAEGGEAAGGQAPRRDGRQNDRGRRDGRRGRRGDRDRSGSGQDRQGQDRPVQDRTAAPAERAPERSDRGSERSDRGSERSDRSDRGGSQDRHRDSRGGGRRQSMQTTNLPAISELLKPGQEILCQIAKEPIAKKGARITSHIALPGRFLVFMPTVHHTGVSRKIESDAERRRLKEILLSERGEATGGFIVRTAAAGASEDELRSDLRFLLNLWTDIKARSESSKSPALIYHDLNLVERILRDQVTDNFSAIWVDTETEYERVLRFLQRFQPSLIRRVKLYTKETPLFEQFGITEEINKALRSKVWLKSGGSIVINQTEALVAIDINTGKFVGKTARLEDTIVKTNLDAIPEIVRQIRLRDLGGIIIIDFIDMDERKNRNKVMAALEEELKSDRAPSKVLQFNDFGLVAITRKRVKQSLERTLSTTCGVCAGTGMVKSPITVCNDIYIEMRKMHKHLDRGDVLLRVNPEVVKQLKSSTKWLQEMEEMVGKTILVKSDPSLHPEQFDIQ